MGTIKHNNQHIQIVFIIIEQEEVKNEFCIMCCLSDAKIRKV